MNWENEGFILSKRKFRENAVILEVFTSDYGKVNGIVYGGTSRKVKNYLQLTNKIYSNIFNNIINSEEFIIRGLKVKTKYYSQKRRQQLFDYLGYQNLGN